MGGGGEAHRPAGAPRGRSGGQVRPRGVGPCPMTRLWGPVGAGHCPNKCDVCDQRHRRTGHLPPTECPNPGLRIQTLMAQKNGAEGGRRAPSGMHWKAGGGGG